MLNGGNLDKVEIADLIIRERVSRDFGRWDDMRACYAAESTVDISWFKGSGFEFVDASRSMANKGAGSFHKIEPCLIDIKGDRATVDVGVTIYLQTMIDGIEASLVSHGRMLFRVKRAENARWYIDHVTGIYVADSLQAAIPGAVIQIDPERLSNYRIPYRFLSYVLHSMGRPASQDLPGIDRPESIAAIREVNEAWLGEAEKPEAN